MVFVCRLISAELRLINMKVAFVRQLILAELRLEGKKLYFLSQCFSVYAADRSVTKSLLQWKLCEQRFHKHAEAFFEYEKHPYEVRGGLVFIGKRLDDVAVSYGVTATSHLVVSSSHLIWQRASFVMAPDDMAFDDTDIHRTLIFGWFGRHIFDPLGALDS